MSADVQLTIRPFHPTNHDYNALIQMNHFRNPDEQLTVAMLRQDDAAFHGEFTAVRVLGELDGQVVAQGTHYHKPDAKQVQGDDFRPDSWAIAVDAQARYVGMCVVNVMSKRPSSLYAGITGVIRSHRRRKIATALKWQSIKFAQQNGFQTIRTDNDENNPMFQLNLDLGFKPLPAWTFYEKSFTKQ